MAQYRAVNFRGGNPVARSSNSKAPVLPQGNTLLTVSPRFVHVALFSFG